MTTALLVDYPAVPAPVLLVGPAGPSGRPGSGALAAQVAAGVPRAVLNRALLIGPDIAPPGIGRAGRPWCDGRTAAYCRPGYGSRVLPASVRRMLSRAGSKRTLARGIADEDPAAVPAATA